MIIKVVVFILIKEVHQCGLFMLIVSGQNWNSMVNTNNIYLALVRPTKLMGGVASLCFGVFPQDLMTTCKNACYPQKSH